MARQIREGPCDFCPVGCCFMVLEVNTDHLYAGGEVINVSNVLSCLHEEACSMWARNSVNIRGVECEE